MVSLSRKSVCGCVRECDLLMRYYSVFQSVVTSKKVSGDWVLRRKREREREDPNVSRMSGWCWCWWWLSCVLASCTHTFYIVWRIMSAVSSCCCGWRAVNRAVDAADAA